MQTWKSVILLFLIAFMPVFLFSQYSNWELQQDDDGIKMYTRDVEGFKLKELRAEVIIDAKVIDIAKVITDFENLEVWADKVDSSYVLKQLDEKTIVNYSIYSTPWPAKDRDLILKTQWNEFNSNIIKIEFVGLPDFIDKNDSFIRISHMVGYWLVEKVNETQSRLTYVFHSDPGGSIPKWMINQVIIKSPKKSIENIRRLAEK